MANNTGLQTGNVDFWVAGWGKLASKVTTRTLIGRRTVGNAGEYTAGYDSAGDSPFFAIFNGSTIQQVNATSFGSAVLNTYFFWLVWQDVVNNTINISINNGTANTATRTVTPTAVSTPFLIGSQMTTPAFFWDGQIDSVVYGKSPPGGIAGVIAAINSELYNSGNGRAAPFNG